MTDEHGVGPASQRLVERDGVHAERARLVEAVGGYLRRRITPLERSHGPVAGLRQLDEEVAPGVGGVGEAVEAEGQRPVAATKHPELDAVGPH